MPQKPKNSTPESKRLNTRLPLRRIFAEYLSAAKPFWIGGTLLFLIYGIAVVLSNLVGPYVIKLIVDQLAMATNTVAQWDTVVHLFLIYVAVRLVRNLCSRAHDFMAASFVTNVSRALERRTFDHLHQRSYKFFTDTYTGSLVAKSRRFVSSFSTIHRHLVTNIWPAVIQLIGVTVILAIEVPLLAKVMVVWVFFYLLATYILSRFKVRYDLHSARANSQVTGRFADVMTNVINLKAFSAGERESQSYGSLTAIQRTRQKRAWDFHNWIFVFQGLAMVALELIALWISLTQWRDGVIPIGTVVLVQSFMTRLGRQLWGIGKSMIDVTRALSDASEMVDIFHRPMLINDPKRPERANMNTGAVRFDHINFEYPGGVKVFDDFCLNIPAGQRVGLVGHSGGGKSTLIKLIVRFLDPQSGSIFIDNQNIKEVSQDDLRQVTSYVPQDPVLFHRTIYENIAYARPDATEAEVIEAVRLAHADVFIDTLPKGYDTMVGERGIKLSGGERQRVAIARAILKDAPVLLLDEATSSLDSVSEQYIQEQLTALMTQRTTVAIAHRISTIQQMDRILVLKSGKIVEDGTHEQLLAESGTYANLWQHQSQGFLVKSPLSTDNPQL